MEGNLVGRGRSRARVPCANRRGSGGGRLPLLRLHQLAQFEVIFVSPGIAKGIPTAAEFAGLIAVLFRVELIVFLVAVCRWCVVLLSEVLSTKHSTVFERLGALEAIEPHGRDPDFLPTIKYCGAMI